MPRSNTAWVAYTDSEVHLNDLYERVRLLPSSNAVLFRLRKRHPAWFAVDSVFLLDLLDRHEGMRVSIPTEWLVQRGMDRDSAAQVSSPLIVESRRLLDEQPPGDHLELTVAGIQLKTGNWLDLRLRPASLRQMIDDLDVEIDGHAWTVNWGAELFNDPDLRRMALGAKLGIQWKGDRPSLLLIPGLDKKPTPLGRLLPAPRRGRPFQQRDAMPFTGPMLAGGDAGGLTHMWSAGDGGGAAASAAPPPPPAAPPPPPPTAPPPPEGVPRMAGGDDPRSETIEVFPDIRPIPAHVVQASELKVVVSLEFAEVDGVAGSFDLPIGRHTVDVHVLLLDKEARGSLEFDSAKGTTRKAELVIEAPALPADITADRGEFPIVANFYLDGRWCGEAATNVEILRHAGIEPAAKLTAIKRGPWKGLLTLDPSAVPPDLTVRIQQARDGAYLFDLVSPHMNFPRKKDQDWLRITPDSYRFLKTTFEGIAAATLDEARVADVKSRLRSIYATTPLAFRDAYWDLHQRSRDEPPAGPRPRLETIAFISDEPYIPWDLMLVSDPDHDDLPEAIISIRHSVGRWLAGGSCRFSARVQVREIAVFAGDYADSQVVKPLPWVADELAFLQKDYGAVPRKLLRKPLEEFLRTGGAQGVHFSCHGEMNVQLPEEAAIRLCDPENSPFHARLIESQDTRKGLGRERPLVFLNACQVGAQGTQIAQVTGWPHSFIRIGAAACVAPLWSVVDANAHKVAVEFYQLAFKERLALGETLRRIRAQWEEKQSLTYLAYTLYGDPAATVVWPAPPQTT